MNQILTLILVFLMHNLSYGQSWIQLGTDIDGEKPNDYSGCSVSMSSDGNTLAIGAPYDGSDAISRTFENGNAGHIAHFQWSGHVRVYEWCDTAWALKGADIDGESTYDYSGASVSMNAAGDRVAIGAILNDGNGHNSGHVRIYEWSGTSWVKLGLDIDGEAAGDYSGTSVSMNAAGDRVAIGAKQNDGNGQDAGHVRIYEWSGTSWVKLGLDIDGEATGDMSGSVSMNAAGDRVAIGANGNDRAEVIQHYYPACGHVRIYEWSGTSWVQLGLDIDGEAAGDNSGASVSMNAAGDRVAIGAAGNDGNGIDAGHVRIYEWSGTSWVKLGLDIDGEATGDRFGASVSMNAAGDRVAIGAILNDGNGSNAGHARIYEWSGTSWVKLGLDIDGEAGGDGSGESVSMNAAGDRVAIGAIWNDGNGIDAGHVRVYRGYN